MNFSVDGAMDVLVKLGIFGAALVAATVVVAGMIHKSFKRG